MKVESSSEKWAKQPFAFFYFLLELQLHEIKVKRSHIRKYVLQVYILYIFTALFLHDFSVKGQLVAVTFFLFDVDLDIYVHATFLINF